MLEKLRGPPVTLIYVTVFVFALTSSAIGSSAGYIPFVLILVALCRTMDLDAMTAVGIIVAGYGIGYGAAAFNQYTVVVAQDVAGVPTYSGWQVRMGILIRFALIGAHHVHSCAQRVTLHAAARVLLVV